MKKRWTQNSNVDDGTTKKNKSTNGLYGDMIKQDANSSLTNQSNTSTGGLYGQMIGTESTASNKATSGPPLSSTSGNSKSNNGFFSNATSSDASESTAKAFSSSGDSIWSKLAGGSFASGVRDIIPRLFGGKNESTTNGTDEKNASGTDGSGTTYAENIGTETTSGNAETSMVTPTTEAAASDNSAGIAAETTESTVKSTAEQPLTYAEYLEMLKSEAKTSWDQADKEAEIAKERAMVNAQSSYAQNQATYGANAETMAQMGLTGGGYSDYLQGQAYAQKRYDVQQANAVESATKAQNRATYQDYVSSINQKLAEKAIYDEQLADQRAYEEKQLAEQRAYSEKQLADERAYNEKQTTDQKTYEEQQTAQNRSDSLYASLWEGVQDSDTTYTAEAIRAIGEEYGLSEAQINTLTTLLTATLNKSAEEKSAALRDAAISDITTNGGDVSDGYLDGLKDMGLSDEDAQAVQDAIDEANKIDITDVISDVQNGGYDEESWDTLKEMLLSARNDGKTITDEDIVNAKFSYDARAAYKQGKISTDDYYDAIGGDKIAIKLVQGILDPELYKSKISNKDYSPDDNEELIYTTSSDFDIEKFGHYAGTGDDGDQDAYLKQIVADAQAGKIAEGQFIIANYGLTWKERGTFAYAGDGVFIKIHDTLLDSELLYVPEGYKYKLTTVTKE